MMKRVDRDHDIEAARRQLHEIGNPVIDTEVRDRAHACDIDHARSEIDGRDLRAAFVRELTRERAGSAADLEHAAAQRNLGDETLCGGLESLGYGIRMPCDPIEICSDHVRTRQHLHRATHVAATLFRAYPAAH